jgi:O-antigen ligase/Tfp pilus assembly protein PilF
MAKRDKEQNVPGIVLTVLVGAAAVVPAFFQGSVAPRFQLVTNLLGAVTLGAWATLMFRGRGATFYRTRMYWLIGAFVYYTLVTASTSIYVEASLTHFFKVANCAILFLVVTGGVSAGLLRREELDVLHLTILLGGFAVAVFALLAPITFLPTDPLHSYPFVNRNNLAGYLELAMPMALAFYFSTRKIELRVTAAGLFLGMALALLASLSRGGIVSFALAMIFFLAVYYFRIRESSRRFVMAVVPPLAILAGVVAITYTPLKAKFGESLIGASQAVSAAERWELYRNALRVIAGAPVFGHGPGTFAYAYLKYRTPGLWGHPYYAHNDWLELLSDSGVVGFGLAAAAILAGLVLVLRTIAIRRDSSKKILAACCLTGVVALILHGLVDFNLRVPSNMMLFAIVSGMALGYAGLPSGAGRTSPYPALYPLTTGRVRKIILFALVGLYVVFAGWFSVTRLWADARFRRGEAFYQSGQFDRAYYEFGRATALVPGNAEYHYRKGISYFLFQKGADQFVAEGVRQTYNLAVRELTEAALINPAESRYLFDLAGVMNDKKAAGLFEPLALKALELEPGNPYLHRTLGLRYLALGKETPGLWHLRRAAKLLPKTIDDATIRAAWQAFPDPGRLLQGFSGSAEVLGRFGRYAASQGEDAVAAQAITKAIALDPGQESLHIGLAALLISQGRFEEARQAAQTIVDRWPTRASGHRMLGYAALKSGDDITAELHLRRAIELEPSAAENYPPFLEIHARLGSMTDLIPFFKQLLDTKKGCLGEVHNHLARLYDLQDEWLLAVNYAKKATNCDAGNLRYAFLLIDLFVKKEHYVEAESRLEMLIRARGEDKDLLRKAAQVCELDGKPKKALGYYVKLQYLMPGDVAIKAKIEQLGRE